MKKLNRIFEYSESEIQRAGELFPAFIHIKNLSERKTTDFFESQRVQRHQAWVDCVLSELIQKNSTAEICNHWSDTADRIIQESAEHIIATSKDSNQLRATGIAVFAYGKLGSSELNLSSDIDLVVISQTESATTTSFIRSFQACLNDNTDLGFCFRTDFDLRPGGRMGPLVPTVDQFVDYYGNYGEAWERLALVRLRPIWGDSKTIDSIMSFAAKMTFRKHLDFSLLADLKVLRQKIHSQYSHRTTDLQIDLKLGVGGIRDLELFVHTLQVVHGGKDPDLRQRKTDDALTMLGHKSILPEKDVEFLRGHYWKMRHLENLVQAKEDQQTHILPINFEISFDLSDLKQTMRRCDELVSSLLGKVDLNLKTVPELPGDQLLWLKSLGFEGDQVEEIWSDLVQFSALSRNRDRDENYRLRFLYLFIEELSQYPEEKLRSFFLLRDFIKATRAKATFYSMFLSQNGLIGNLAKLFAHAPYLGKIITTRPELIDSFIYKNQLELPTDPHALLTALNDQKLLAELINGSEFISTLDLQALTERSSAAADSICLALLNSIDPNRRLKILALGKWGGLELGLRSDLDFIFITDTEVQESDLKLARRFFNRLTETHQNSGSLYSIDLRLKPAGKGGLVVTSKKDLAEYLSKGAEAWERQAYLRSRIIGKVNLDLNIPACYIERNVSAEELQELSKIRVELLKNAKVGPDLIDLKYSEGGLVDIEFACQIEFLNRKMTPTSSNTNQMLAQLGWNTLSEAYVFMRLVEQVAQVASYTSNATIDYSSDTFKLTSSTLNCSISELKAKIQTTFEHTISELKRLDPRRRP